MFELWQRFQNEVKANGKQAALLAGLFLFGCCFWVPMIARAVSPKHAMGAAAAPNMTTTMVPTDTPPSEPEGSDQFWSSLAKSLADDPMYQSADIRELSRDPFQAPEVHEPQPVQVEKVTPPPVEERNEVKASEKLSLTSTIIGRSRRAALINGQLYQQGRRVKANGRTYLLTKVESNRVVLSSNGETIELTLPRPQLKDVLDQDESTGSPSR